jgi:hypothetical protein
MQFILNAQAYEPCAITNFKFLILLLKTETQIPARELYVVTRQRRLGFKVRSRRIAMMVFTRLLTLALVTLSLNARAHICEDASIATRPAANSVQRANPFPDQPDLWINPQNAVVLENSKLHLNGKTYEITIDECPRDQGQRVMAFTGEEGDLRVQRGSYVSGLTPLFMNYEFEGQMTAVKAIGLIGTRPTEIYFSHSVNTGALKGYIFPVRQVKFYDSGEVQAFGLSYEGASKREFEQSGFALKVCGSESYEWTYLHRNGLFFFGRCAESYYALEHTYMNQVVLLTNVQFHENGNLMGATIKRKKIRSTPIDEDSPILVRAISGQEVLIRPGQVFFAPDGVTAVQGEAATQGFDVMVKNQTMRLLPYSRDAKTFIEYGHFDFYDNGTLRFGNIEPAELMAINGQNLTCTTVGFFKNGDLALCGMPEGKEANFKVGGHALNNVHNVSFFPDGSIRQAASRNTSITVQNQTLGISSGDYTPRDLDSRSIVVYRDQINPDYEPHFFSGSNTPSFPTFVEFYQNGRIKQIDGLMFDGLYSLEKSDGSSMWIGKGVRTVFFDEDEKIRRVYY